MEERQDRRLVTDINVNYRAGDFIGRAVVHNIAAHGCMMVTEDDRLVAALRLAVELPGAGWTEGEVAWHSGNVVGIRFENALSAAMTASLADPGSAFDMASTRPIDRFGRALPPLPRTRWR